LWNYDYFYPVLVRKYFVGDAYELRSLKSPTKKPKTAKSGDLASQEMPPYLNKACLGNIVDGVLGKSGHTRSRPISLTPRVFFDLVETK
jgi:hypothetical protein